MFTNLGPKDTSVALSFQHKPGQRRSKVLLILFNLPATLNTYEPWEHEINHSDILPGTCGLREVNLFIKIL